MPTIFGLHSVQRNQDHQSTQTIHFACCTVPHVFERLKSFKTSPIWEWWNFNSPWTLNLQNTCLLLSLPLATVKDQVKMPVPWYSIFWWEEQSHRERQLRVCHMRREEEPQGGTRGWHASHPMWWNYDLALSVFWGGKTPLEATERVERSREREREGVGLRNFSLIFLWFVQPVFNAKKKKKKRKKKKKKMKKKKKRVVRKTGNTTTTSSNNIIITHHHPPPPPHHHHDHHHIECKCGRGNTEKHICHPGPLQALRSAIEAARAQQEAWCRQPAVSKSGSLIPHPSVLENFPNWFWQWTRGIT